jgi:uncharacterized protein (TIGR02246 family)
MQNRLKILAGVMVVSAVVAGCARKDTDEKEDSAKTMAAAAPAVDKSAAEAAIRQGDEAYFNAVKAKDATAIAALYSDDAVSNPANSPPLVGNAAIKKYNEDFLKTPQLTVTGEATSIKFSDDGSVAYETGKYSGSFVDAKGRTIKGEGKFLNVLKNIGGKWKVVVDAFSSNLAQPM